MELIVDSNRGIYGPQVFCQKIFPAKFGHGERHYYDCTVRDIEICLTGPDDEDYWDAWSTIVYDFINERGQGILENEGDIWLAYPGETEEQINNDLEYINEIM